MHVMVILYFQAGFSINYLEIKIDIYFNTLILKFTSIKL